MRWRRADHGRMEIVDFWVANRAIFVAEWVSVLTSGVETPKKFILPLIAPPVPAVLTLPSRFYLRSPWQGATRNDRIRTTRSRARATSRDQIPRAAWFRSPVPSSLLPTLLSILLF